MRNASKRMSGTVSSDERETERENSEREERTKERKGSYQSLILYIALEDERHVRTHTHVAGAGVRTYACTEDEIFS